LDRGHSLEYIEEHLDEEEETEDGEHGDGEDGLGREEALVAVPHGVEEEENELLQQQGDHDTVDSAAMNVLVDLGSLVGEVDVVPVHAMLNDEIEEAKGRDQGADHRVGHSQGEDEEHPAVVDPVGELVGDGLAHAADLSLAPGETKTNGVHEQLGESQELQSCPNKSAGYDIVDEEGSVVGEKDALPVDCSIGRVFTLDNLDQKS